MPQTRSAQRRRSPEGALSILLATAQGLGGQPQQIRRWHCAQRFVSSTGADRSQRSRNKEGHPKVAFLFPDPKSYSALLEGADPEDVRPVHVGGGRGESDTHEFL